MNNLLIPINVALLILLLIALKRPKIIYRHQVFNINPLEIILWFVNTEIELRQAGFGKRIVNESGVEYLKVVNNYVIAQALIQQPEDNEGEWMQIHEFAPRLEKEVDYDRLAH